MQLPTDFIQKYQELLQEQAPAFLESLQGDVQKGFRLNPLKQNYQEVQFDLSKPVAYVPTGYYGEVSGKTIEHQAGYVYSQDLSAMYVAEVCAPQPGDKVLDLCAAPGGKTTHLAGLLKQSGLLVSNEINRKRASILAENVERIGAKNVIILNETPAKLASQFPEYFDKIVVDAPCSGEGMFRKDPNAINYWTKDYPATCALRQKEILQEALKMLRPGGQLVYSTCTFAPEEDEQIIAWLLKQYPTLEILPIQKFTGMDDGRPEFADNNPTLTNTLRLMPHHFKGEGHFIAKLQDTRAQSETIVNNNKKKRSAKQQLSSEQYQLWQEFCQNTLVDFPTSIHQLKCYGDHLYLYQPEWPDLSKLKFMRPGLLLGTFKKKRFEPSYALALALQPQQVKNVLEVTSEQWQAYVAGNVVSLDKQVANGWYLLTCHKKPFSFGKVVYPQVKNFFPKALRFQ